MRRPIATPRLRGLNQMGIAAFNNVKSVKKAARNLKRPEPGTEAFEKFKKPLDAFNDSQSVAYLHATKGYRRMSVKRGKAQMVTAAIRNAQLPFSMTLMQRELAE